MKTTEYELQELREENAKLTESHLWLRRVLAAIVMESPGGQVRIDEATIEMAPREPQIVTRKDSRTYSLVVRVHGVKSLNPTT